MGKWLTENTNTLRECISQITLEESYILLGSKYIYKS